MRESYVIEWGGGGGGGSLINGNRVRLFLSMRFLFLLLVVNIFWYGAFKKVMIWLLMSPLWCSGA